MPFDNPENRNFVGSTNINVSGLGNISGINVTINGVPINLGSNGGEIPTPQPQPQPILDDFSADMHTSGRIDVNGQATGQIETRGDNDWFAIELEEGKTYTIDLTGAQSNNGSLSDPFFKGIYDASGRLLGGQNDDAFSGGLDSKVTFVAESSGTHFFSAGAYGRETGTYTINVTEEETSAPVEPTPPVDPTTPVEPVPNPNPDPTDPVTPTEPAPNPNPEPVESQFDIDLNYSGNEAYRGVFEEACAIWENIIIGDLPDVHTSQGVIDDLQVNARVTSIDGRFGILGRAGPDGVRSMNDGGLTYSGSVQMDQADMQVMEDNGNLLSVIVHEIAHIVGFGTLWDRFGLMEGGQYVGENALREYSELLGREAPFVPVEDEGGPGTAGSHWDEFIFQNELMTGFSESRPPSPLSTITIGSLEDMGYQVNYDAAEPYTLPRNNENQFNDTLLVAEADSFHFTGNASRSDFSLFSLACGEELCFV